MLATVFPSQEDRRMRRFASYSTPALTALTAFSVACSDAVAPDGDILSLDRGVSAADRKKPAPPPADVTPPTTPALSATDVGSRHVSLAWSSTDDRTYNITYSITVNGTPDPDGSTYNTSRSYYVLQPSTGYTFTVRARDNAGNVSAPGTLTVTTRALDPNDRQPPSAPTNVGANDFASGTEFLATWTASTDNVDSQAALRYDVFVNGELSDVVFGKTQSINYGVNGNNTVSVIAIDANGNRSEAGTTTIVFNQ